MLHLNNEEQLKIGNYIITAHEGDILIEDKYTTEKEYITSMDTLTDFDNNMDTFRKYFQYNEFVKIVQWYFKMENIDDIKYEEQSLKDRLQIIKMIRRQEIEEFLCGYEQLKPDMITNSYCRLFSFRRLLSCKILAEIEEVIGLSLSNITVGQDKVCYEFADKDWGE